jgi:hypothetical protein
MAVGSGALNPESISRSHERFAFQYAAEVSDLRGGPVGEVGKRAFDDLAIQTGRLAEEDGRRRVTVAYGFHVHGDILP